MSKHKAEKHQCVIMIRGKGTGFVSLPDVPEDVIIAREDLNTALDGDIVEIELGVRSSTRPAYRNDHGAGRQTGRVTKIIERARNEYIGTIKEDGKVRYLDPDSRRIHVRFMLPDATKSDVGMKVAATLREWKNPNVDPIGEIVEVLGPQGDHETEMQAIIRAGGIAIDFPKDVAQRAQELYKDKERLFEDALKDPKRRDMRHVTTCTIDPKDAKDFDDAISLTTLKNGNYEVGIHIADVSYYVKENDAIDTEAQERGTSIYLVDRVIPMLPEVLSNDLCSLRPNEDRLAFSAIFEITPKGKVQNQWFGQTIIHSDKRFTYEEAQAILDRSERSNRPTDSKNQSRDVLDTGVGPLKDELGIWMNISRVLRKERYKKGAIAFEQPEVRFELDKNGKPIRAYTKTRTETMLMIEDYMLLANRKVAEHIYNLCKESGRDAAFVYRVHDVPNPDKIEELSIFLHALGYEFRTHKGMVEATDINKLLKEVEGKPEENLIKTTTIRSMAKAVYTTKNIGHFGLAFKFYTHFTSPIRRYPDLMAHRLLRRHLDGSKISGKELSKYEKLSIQSSERELTVVEAERDSIKFKQVEYLEDKIGSTFTGVITGVTDWGIYVEEKESKAEGMVKLASIKSDYFTYDAKNYRVTGEKTKKTYRLGDEVSVKLVAADPQERTIDFELIF